MSNIDVTKIRVRYGGLVRVTVDQLLTPAEARQLAQEILDAVALAEAKPNLDEPQVRSVKQRPEPSKERT